MGRLISPDVDHLLLNRSLTHSFVLFNNLQSEEGAVLDLMKHIQHPASCASHVQINWSVVCDYLRFFHLRFESFIDSLSSYILQLKSARVCEFHIVFNSKQRECCQSSQQDVSNVNNFYLLSWKNVRDKLTFLPIAQLRPGIPLESPSIIYVNVQDMRFFRLGPLLGVLWQVLAAYLGMLVCCNFGF